MNSSSVNEDKLKKLSPLYRGCLDRWLSQVRAGRSLLDSILEIRSKTFCVFFLLVQLLLSNAWL